jgi:hypothetical protein
MVDAMELQENGEGAWKGDESPVWCLSLRGSGKRNGPRSYRMVSNGCGVC